MKCTNCKKELQTIIIYYQKKPYCYDCYFKIKKSDQRNDWKRM